MKRSWLISGALGGVGLVSVLATVFLMAPAEERIFNIIFHDVYGQQQIAVESDAEEASEPYHICGAEVKDSSGATISITCEVCPTHGIASQWIKREPYNLQPISKPSIPIGENALSRRGDNGQYHLDFQRDNLYITVTIPRDELLPADSIQVASIEATARILDLAIAKRQTGVQTVTISNGHCLKAYVNWWRKQWWEKHGRNKLWEFLHGEW